MYIIQYRHKEKPSLSLSGSVCVCVYDVTRDRVSAVRRYLFLCRNTSALRDTFSAECTSSNMLVHVRTCIQLACDAFNECTQKGNARTLTHCLTRSLIRLCKWDPQLLQLAITCSQRRQRGARARTAPWSHFIIKCQTAAVAAAAAAQRLSERRQRRAVRASELVSQSCNTFCVFRINKTKKKNRKKCLL